MLTMASYACEHHHDWHTQTTWTNEPHSVQLHTLGTGPLSVGRLKVIYNSTIQDDQKYKMR